jgi:hypothetical protein
MGRVAIIGAGVTGLVAAHTLHSIGTEVSLFEKSRGVGGRTATRWHDLPDGRRVYLDHGAQYLKAESPTMSRYLHELLPTGDLVDIGRPVWVFNGDGTITEGDPHQNSAPKWVYRQGVATFAKLIAQVGGLDVRLNTRVGKLVAGTQGYTLLDEFNKELMSADQVLITVPSGQAAELLEASQIPRLEAAQLAEILRNAKYRRCITVIFGVERVLTERPYYALVNTDRQHPVSWIGMEHAKPGHVPAGHSVVIAQMAGQYSAENWDEQPASVIAEVAEMVSTVLGEDLRAPDWTEYQKWRYALPDQTVSEQTLNGVVPGLWFAGDWGRGGRVHLAAQVGYEIAQRLRG